MAETSLYARAQEALDSLQGRIPDSLRNPKVAIICGSGLGGLVDCLAENPRAEFNYASIPHFATSSVAGHAGKLVFGLLGHGVPAVLMAGRSHYYEGHAIDRITFPVRLFKLLGVEIVIVTNASGGLNSEYDVGDIVVINDHIFMAGMGGIHPLRGPNADEFGVRFPALSDAYDLELRRTTHRAWRKVIPPETKRRLHEGVYAFLSGPSYETRAECRLLRQLGADLVGMSTVPEIIVARHCSLRVLALSIVTNKAVLAPVPRGDDHLLQDSKVEDLNRIVEEGKATHEEVLEAGKHAAAVMEKLVSEIVNEELRGSQH